MLVGPEEHLDPAAARMRASPLPRRGDLPHPRVLGFLACAAVIRRSAFLGVGGFASRLPTGGAEALLALDLARDGWDLAYADEVVAHHHPPAGRDPGPQHRQLLRNAVLAWWLRRPATAAFRRTVEIARSGLREPVTRGGLLDAVRELPWLLHARRPVPAWLEADLRLLETARLDMPHGSTCQP